MTDQIILKKLLDKNHNINRNINKIISFEDINYLQNRFIDINNYKEALYCLKNNLLESPKCPICGKKLEWKNTYGKTCGNKDCIKSLIHLKGKQSKLKKYGDENYNNRLKIKQTKLERYGSMTYTNPEKMKQTKLKRYGSSSFVNPEKAKQTCLKKYGVNSIFATEKIKKINSSRPIEEIKKIKKKMKQTKLEKYGSSSFVNPEKAKQTKLEKYGDINYNNRKKAQETCLNRYNSKNFTTSEKWYKIISDPKWQEKRKKAEYITKKKNHSFKISKPENECYSLLKNRYNDIKRQYKSDKYPFNCDFYIPNLDLYIEYNGSWTHGKHPFNSNSAEDINKLKLWESKNSQYYNNAINTWTIRDIKKREIAKKNNLNYIEFWNLEEVKKWISN